MILKRLYLKTRTYGYFFHPEIKTYHEFIEFSECNPKIDCAELDNASYVISDLSHEEQDNMWYNSIKNIMQNTRAVLDNLDGYYEYQVRWNNYGKKRKGQGCPPNVLTTKLDNNYNWISF